MQSSSHPPLPANISVPGFIDTHSHDDIALTFDPERRVKRVQGIVHQVVGNCGLSPFPVIEGENPVHEHFLRSVLGKNPGTTRSFFPTLDEYRAAIPKNVSILVGYNTLRYHLFPESDGPLTAGETRQMQSALRVMIERGACGVSMGLAYPPGSAIDSIEIAAVAQVTPLLAVHVRNESSRVIGSIREVANAVIASDSRCHLHLSHVKIAGRKNWGLLEELFDLLGELRGIMGLTFDHYPFAFGSTALSAVLPPEFCSMPREQLAKVKPSDIDARLADPTWENYVDFAGGANLELAGLVHHPELNGCSLEGMPLGRTLRDLVVSEPSPAVLIRSQSDEVVDELLKLPYGCIGTDGLPDVAEHPRLYSTFPEYLQRMKRLGQSLTLAVEKASTLPRRIFHIANGDTVGIDPETFRLVDGVVSSPSR